MKVLQPSPHLSPWALLGLVICSLFFTAASSAPVETEPDPRHTSFILLTIFVFLLAAMFLLWGSFLLAMLAALAGIGPAIVSAFYKRPLIQRFVNSLWPRPKPKRDSPAGKLLRKNRLKAASGVVILLVLGSILGLALIIIGIFSVIEDILNELFGN